MSLLPTIPGEPAHAGSPRRTPRLNRSPLVGYVLGRLGIGVVLLVAVSLLIFWGTQVLPGDAARAILGRTATPGALEALRAELGLDRPVIVQYLDWAAGFVRGDLGTTLGARTPVGDFIAPRLANTAVLAGATFLVLIPLSLALGVWSALRRDRAEDQIIGGFSLGVIAIPEFVSGTLLVAVFAVGLGWLPAVSLVSTGGSPLASPEVLVLPVVTLVLAGLAYIVRQVRAGVIGVLDSDYVEMARLNGIPERRTVWRHVLPNALAPSVQIIALTTLWLVGGVVIVETVFQYPGLGLGLIQSVRARDIPTVQAITMIVAALYIVINIVADVVVVLLIPKLRTSL